MLHYQSNKTVMNVNCTQKLELMINKIKKKIMTAPRTRRRTEPKVKTGQYTLEIVEEFIYDTRTELWRRINNANRVYFAVPPLLRGHTIPRSIKVRIINCSLNLSSCIEQKHGPSAKISVSDWAHMRGISLEGSMEQYRAMAIGGSDTSMNYRLCMKT